MTNKIICLILPILLFSSLTEAVSVKSKIFGKTEDGGEVTLYELINDNGLRATVMDYGAILVDLQVPDRNGKLADINLGFDELEPYIKRNPLFGAVVGRYAIRIENASFTIDGVEYKITKNA
ncbi:MAG: aldose epimerase family protein, partial [Planctomycetota bacterium]